jgi:cytochrome c2
MFILQYENLGKLIWMVLMGVGVLVGISGFSEASDHYTQDLKQIFREEVDEISKLKGDTVSGELLFAICQGCHNVNSSYGVSNLDKSGDVYDKDYLIALIKNPAIATNTEHMYKDAMLHPMGSIAVMIDNKQDIANVVAYIKEKKISKTSDREKLEKEILQLKREQQELYEETRGLQNLTQLIGDIDGTDSRVLHKGSPDLLNQKRSNVDSCKSKTFSKLLRSVANELKRGNKEKSLKLSKKASSLCPSNETLKDTIEYLKNML